MIRRTASAVFLLRDGFTGTAFTGGAGAFVELDGRPVSRPVWKREGYLVLLDLAPGEHSLLIRRAGYRDELVTFPAEEGKTMEDTISLKPGPGYRFPAETVRVTLRLSRGAKAAAGEQIWLGTPTRTKLRLAQEKARCGDREVHIFCEGNSAALPIPGHFLLTDKKAPELVFLRSLRGETGQLAPPLGLDHGRGTEFVPVQVYMADAAGRVQVLLREPGTLLGFSGGKVYELPLRVGEQESEWKLED